MVRTAPLYHVSSLFFFNDTATTEIYTLSLHDALPISRIPCSAEPGCGARNRGAVSIRAGDDRRRSSDHRRWKRSEEHTSELQSQSNLVCRLLLEKKKTTQTSSSALP